MRTLMRNKRKIYLCQKYLDNTLTNTIVKFREPITLQENYVPTNSDGDLIAIGLNYPKFLRIKTDISEKDLFHAKDRVYVYKEPPITHDALCKDADYEVYKQPSLFINEMEVMLYRLSDDDE